MNCLNKNFLHAASVRSVRRKILRLADVARNKQCVIQLLTGTNRGREVLNVYLVVSNSRDSHSNYKLCLLLDIEGTKTVVAFLKSEYEITCRLYQFYVNESKSASRLFLRSTNFTDKDYLEFERLE